MIRNFTGSALELYGYTVLLARDGQEGVQLLAQRSGDIRLVLLDVAMPEMDGLATLERIREIRRGVPVIVCSGFGDADVETRFTGTNIAGFLPKPYTEKELAKKVKECMPTAVDCTIKVRTDRLRKVTKVCSAVRVPLGASGHVHNESTHQRGACIAVLHFRLSTEGSAQKAVQKRV